MTETLRGIVFDFDGVVLESVDIKTRAFVELFSDHPELHAAIARHHLDNAGVSRYDKFRWIYETLLGRELDAADSKRLGEAFSEIVYREILACPFVAGAEAFLRAAAQSYRLFIASGTPQEELRDIVLRRGLNELFVSVEGTPRTKGVIVRDLMAEHRLAAHEIVFIGDALADLAGAREAGVAFVARVPRGEVSVFPPGAAIVEVADLDELAERWAEVTALVEGASR